MKKKITIVVKIVFVVTVLAALIGCGIPGTSELNQDTGMATGTESTLAGNSLDQPANSGKVELVIGLKDGSKSLADAVSEIESVINAALPVNNNTYSTREYVTLTRVHETGSITKEVRSSNINSVLSEDQIIQSAYDNLSNETEKALFRDFQFTIDAEYAALVTSALENNADVEYVQENYLNVMYDNPNDPYFRNGKLWGLTKSYCDKAWDITKGNENIIVAVIDSGVDGNHPDLKDNLWVNSQGTWGYDFSDDDWYPSPDGSHGTHVAGTVAAVGNNGQGVIGVAPNVTIMAVKIFPNAYSTVCAKAIRYAVDNGARVLNNSWGPNSRHPEDPTIEKAIEYAYSKGAVVVFAAGNSNDDAGYYHGGNSPYAVCVAAVDSNFNRASFSNYGSVVDIAAPGVSIQSTVPNGGYSSKSGTSMAAPHIAGLAALILSRNPGYSNSKVLQVMKDTVIPISATNIGAGVMNAYKAVQGGSPVDTQAPSTPANLSAESTTSTVSLSWSASTDNVGVTGYKVYKNGVYAKTVSAAGAEISGLAAKTTYTFAVSAVDAAGNESGKGTISVTTKGGGTDMEAPSRPANLTAGTVTTSSVSLSWSVSTDNVAVTGYKIYQNGVYAKTVSTNSAVISGLAAKTTYSFTVSAVDAAGNESGKSSSLSVTTKDGSGGTTWKTYTSYSIGDIVLHNGIQYRCRQAHTSLPGWEPSIVPALWLKL